MRIYAKLGLMLAALTGCSDVCRNNVVQRLSAPYGRHQAIMFQRDCGATTGFSTQISVIDRGERATGSGNAYRADADHGAAAVGHWGGPWAEVRWLAPDHLVVRYAENSRIFEQDDRVSGIRISYRSVSR